LLRQKYKNIGKYKVKDFYIVAGVPLGNTLKHHYCMTSEIITVIANVALALSLIVAVIFGIAQVRSAARDRRERLTLETMRQFQTREFAELIYFINYHDMPANRDEFFARPPAELAMYIQFGQEMESLGLLVAEKLVDIDLIDKTLGSFVTAAWEKYKSLFLDMRINNPDPFLGEYFQWLAERIDERMKTNPRKPFYKVG